MKEVSAVCLSMEARDRNDVLTEGKLRTCVCHCNDCNASMYTDAHSQVLKDVLLIDLHFPQQVADQFLLSYLETVKVHHLLRM